MRKLLLAIVAVALFAGMALAQAPRPSDVVITANVAPVWTLDVSVAALTFNVDAGGAAVALPVVATVYNNYNVAWAVWLTKDQDLTNTVTPADIIPSTEFVFAGTGGEANGQWTPGEFPVVAGSGYERLNAYKVKNGLPLTTTLTLQVLDPDQAAGEYTNTITYTLIANP